MFENLEVHQKAVDLADEVTALTTGFPRGYYFLADEPRRAPGPSQRTWPRQVVSPPRRTESTSLPPRAARSGSASRRWRSPEGEDL